MGDKNSLKFSLFRWFIFKNYILVIDLSFPQMYSKKNLLFQINGKCVIRSSDFFPKFYIKISFKFHVASFIDSKYTTINRQYFYSIFNRVYLPPPQGLTTIFCEFIEMMLVKRRKIQFSFCFTVMAINS